MELWDILDKKRNKTGRTHKRGNPMQKGDYHLVVQVWIVTEENKILLTKRSAQKEYPLVWETTAGAAVVGDDSLTAALREVDEETGITLDTNNGKFIYTFMGSDFFMDVWVFKQAIAIKDIVLQQGETCAAQLATVSQVQSLMDADEFIPIFGYRKKIFEMVQQEAFNLPSNMMIKKYPVGKLDHSQLIYAVFIARHKQKWVLVNHKARTTWEVPGGHIENGEHVDETAKRELFEETGATMFDISPICDYTVTRDGIKGAGRLYIAHIKKLGPLPNLEIEKIALYDELPDNLTYPYIQTALLQFYFNN